MNFSPSDSLEVGTHKLAFFETLVSLLPVRSVSDRTCFRRVAEWLAEGVQAGRLPQDVFGTALLYAREATVGRAKNPNAVFMSLLRKELGYDPAGAQKGGPRCPTSPPGPRR